MKKIETFRDLDAWHVAMDLVVASYALVAKFPHSERFELSSQVRKSAVSVPSNIAEGQGYGPGLRYLNHVRMAGGSLAELDTQLEAAVRLKFIAPADLEPVRALIDRTGRLITGLRHSIQRRCATRTSIWAFGFVVVFSWLSM